MSAITDLIERAWDAATPEQRQEVFFQIRKIIEQQLVVNANRVVDHLITKAVDKVATEAAEARRTEILDKVGVLVNSPVINEIVGKVAADYMRSKIKGY